MMTGMFHARRLAGVFVLVLGAQMLTAQEISTQRVVHVTVTDPQHRFIAGLTAGHFTILENGTRRRIIAFSDPDSPVTVAIADASQSVDEAARQLAASKLGRKVLIATESADLQTVPAGVEVLKVHSAIVRKAEVEVRNQYVIRFESTAPSAAVEVFLQQPKGLPVLKANWK
jgi:hypothetical protein